MPDTHTHNASGPNALFDFLESPEGSEIVNRIKLGEVTSGELFDLADAYCVSRKTLVRIAQRQYRSFNCL